MIDPDRLKLGSRVGCFLRIFGIPFLFAGLAVMTSPLFGTMKSKDGKKAPVYFVVPFGLVFASVGAAFTLGRSGVVLDRRLGKVIKWWGLLVPMKRKEHPLENFEWVGLRREVRRTSKGRSYTVFPVRLEGKGNTLDLAELHDYTEARKRAEEVAKFLDCDLREKRDGRTVVREAGKLDESLRERMQRIGEQVTMPQQPADGKTKFEIADDEATFDTPARGFHFMHFVPMAGGVIMLALISYNFLRPLLRDAQKSPALYVFLGFVGLFCLVVVGVSIVPSLMSATRRERVTASPRGLRVRRRSCFGGRTREIPAGELEELKLTAASRRDPFSLRRRSRVISARSDRRVLEFGLGLSDDELVWLRDVVKMIVTAPGKGAL